MSIVFLLAASHGQDFGEALQAVGERDRDVGHPVILQYHLTNFLTNWRTPMGGVNLADAKARLSELVSKAEGGEETVITRRGQPVARLVPMVSPRKAFRSLAQFRATLPKARKASAQVIRQLRDEGY